LLQPVERMATTNLLSSRDRVQTNRYVSPASCLNYEDFVLEANCVNGHRGMQQLVSVSTLPAAKVQIRVIGESTGEEDSEKDSNSEIRMISMYCKFGKDCSKEYCRYMHTTRTLRRRGHSRPLESKKIHQQLENKSHSEPPKQRSKMSSSRRRRLRRKRQKEKWNAVARIETAAATQDHHLFIESQSQLALIAPYQMPRAKTWDNDMTNRGGNNYREQYRGGSRIRSSSSSRYISPPRFSSWKNSNSAWVTTSRQASVDYVPKGHAPFDYYVVDEWPFFDYHAGIGTIKPQY